MEIWENTKKAARKKHLSSRTVTINIRVFLQPLSPERTVLYSPITYQPTKY